MPVTVVHCSDGTPLEVNWNEDHWPNYSFGLNDAHWKYPATALDIWLDPLAPRRMRAAFEEVGLRQIIAAQFAGPYQYIAIMEPTGEQLGQMMASVGALMARFGSPLRFWQEFCEPRAKQATEDLEGPLQDAPMDRVAEVFAYGLAQTFTSLTPIFGAAMPLQMLLIEVFGPEGAMLAHEVTQSGKNASQAMDEELAELAGLARETPAVARILSDMEGAQRRAALANEPSGQTFVNRFDEFVAQHATRSFGWELTLPTWEEDPDAVLSMVAALARNERPGGVAAESERLRDAARERALAALSPAQQAQFQGLVTMLDGLVTVRENRAYWQMRLHGALRRLLLERGRALVGAGRLERPDDILHLLPEEFEAEATGDLRGLAAARRAEWLAAAQRVPPTYIGAPPAQPLPESQGERELRGVGVSRGVVTGRARIFESPDDIERMEEGDILVGRMTTPAWTPLFGLAGGVVMESGDQFSHPAITSREYGIPCVLGVRGATTKIPDGATITVDGLAGTVTLVRAAEPTPV